TRTSAAASLLDVPIPKAVQDSPAKYQIHLKSVKGPIDVVLLNKHSVSSVPVVLPVPPADEDPPVLPDQTPKYHRSERSLHLLTTKFVIFSPLLRLSPPPSDRDYFCNLDESEGVCDLFDVPMLNV
uniref:E2F transcription factor CC-MB domain-containing protein n=1 Tax=Stegastes partitus TaxID=144197 RepID=A0A3B4ZUC1_9TELE